MRATHGIMAALFVLILWQILVLVLGLPNFILPAPLKVGQVWWTSRALIFEHSFYTMVEVFIGLAIGATFGALSAIILAYSTKTRILLRPILVFSQAIPVFALAPILTLWLGYGLWSKVAMAVLIIYFPVTSAFLDGLMRTPQGFLDLAQTMQASKRMVMWKIKIPAALPSLASGLKLAATYAPIGAVIGEWVGSSKGLGYLMLLANGRAKTDLMFAAMITLGIFSVILYLMADYAAKRLAPDANHSKGI